MSKKLISAAVVAGGFAIGLAPAAHADINREVCLAVMAVGVDPYNPSDNYALNMLDRYPDMTYNQANDLVKKAFGSVRWHNNPMCNGVTIPENY